MCLITYLKYFANNALQKELRSQGSAVGTVTGLQAAWSGASTREAAKTFLFSKMSRQALGPNQRPMKWVLGFFSSVTAAKTQN
jgi:hypothetical protein